MPRVHTFGFIRHVDYGLHLFQLFKRYMTFDDVAVCHSLLRRRLIITNIADSPMAAGTKWAALRGIHCAGQISFQHNFTFRHFRIGDRHC